ncbi:TfuA-like protein [Plantactinospora sp. KBS50]|uniref:TfuA-like protein n=1 Tax=Plantactinospora sp. KBS50 TaxID=2024580 RepID=UPI000BAAC0B5|nr:TfuA-like protein [Plantactinospora sp. KBS50]ASW53563.1 hypothetical protein CIK06_04245 [Plantactinospora sp. KBS50]
MNRLLVYAGPTLPASRVAAIAPDAEVRPPVESGTLQRDRIGAGDVAVIIDGLYRDRPAVRHKEILRAVDAGAVVIGAASMGAMRAAELDGLGMVGVGEVYRMYASGDIDGDDEVAVRHSPQELGYRADSVALVNLRYGGKLAVSRQVAPASAVESLIEAARGLVFDERTWTRLASFAPASLIQFLRRAECDVKARDAAEAVAHAMSVATATADTGPAATAAPATASGPATIGPAATAPAAAAPATASGPAASGPAATAGASAGTAPPWRTSYLRDWVTYWQEAELGPSGDWVAAVDVLEAARLHFDGYPELHHEALSGMLRELTPDPAGFAMRSLGLRVDSPPPERLAMLLSAPERTLPVPEQAVLILLRSWPINLCRDWRPRVLALLRRHPAWPEWTALVHRADDARNDGGTQARPEVAAMLFLHRWGASGPTVPHALARRGFLTLPGLERSAVRFGTLALRQRAAMRR